MPYPDGTTPIIFLLLSYIAQSAAPILYTSLPETRVPRENIGLADCINWPGI